MTDGELPDVVAKVLSSWSGHDSSTAPMTPQTVENFSSILNRFVRFAAVHDVHVLSQIDPKLVAAFVAAKGRTRHGKVDEASLSTRHNRRSVVRAFAKESRRLGYDLTDPTVDLDLPFRQRLFVRPVTEPEAALLRRFSESWSRPTRHAAAVGLTLSGLHTGEVGRVLLSDIHDSTVRAPGTHTVLPRMVPLDPWAARVVADRAAVVRRQADPDLTLTSRVTGTEMQRQSRTCTAIRDVIKRAGLDADPQIRPASLTALAGVRQFAQTGRIEDVAKLLGAMSLDRAAATIDWRWRDQ